MQATSDGIPLDTVPHVSDDHPRHTDVPVRDFEVGVSGRQLIERDIDERPLIGVVFTDSDMPVDQLRSGGGMMRLMIEAELLGLASCSLSQAVDLTAFRGRLQGLMGWTGYPQMMLRIGHPAETAQQFRARRVGQHPTSFRFLLTSKAAAHLVSRRRCRRPEAQVGRTEMTFASSFAPRECATLAGKREKGVVMRAVVAYESMYGNTRKVLTRSPTDCERGTRSRSSRSTGWTRNNSIQPGSSSSAATHVRGMSRASTRKAAVAAADKPGSTLTVEPDVQVTAVRELLTSLGRLNVQAAVFDTKIKMAALLSGRASLGIAKGLRRHGARMLAKPESFLVTKDNRLCPGEEDRRGPGAAARARCRRRCAYQ